MTISNDILILPLECDLDVANVPRVRAIINEHLAKGCRRVIINMEKATYIDSLGVALLLSVARTLHAQGGLLSLTNVNSSIYRMLVICRLVDFIPVTNTANKTPIPALDPTVHPLWQGTMHVEPQKLSAVRQRIEEVLERATELSANEIFDLTLAGGEALGNAIDHTGGQPRRLGLCAGLRYSEAFLYAGLAPYLQYSKYRLAQAARLCSPQ